MSWLIAGSSMKEDKAISHNTLEEIGDGAHLIKLVIGAMNLWFGAIDRYLCILISEIIQIYGRLWTLRCVYLCALELAEGEFRAHEQT